MKYKIFQLGILLLIIYSLLGSSKSIVGMWKLELEGKTSTMWLTNIGIALCYDNEDNFPKFYSWMDYHDRIFLDRIGNKDTYTIEILSIEEDSMITVGGQDRPQVIGRLCIDELKLLQEGPPPIFYHWRRVF